ncbi:MAG TPA: magnesium transporter CorA [Lachnospiraceae bacterium]|nr:magnesium transporter CorA [Lachnospiraceae bacterium]
MYYLIGESLKTVSREELKDAKEQYVAIVSFEEWKESRDSFEMGIDLEQDNPEIYTTKAEVNYDSLTGTFSIPNREDFSKDDFKFAFALDEKGIVFIDDSGKVSEIIRCIQNTKRWKLPSLERFIYDFLDQIVIDDLRLMEKYERELDEIEKLITDGEEKLPSGRLNEIRNDIRDLRIHYDQLMDLGQELEENENNFFKQENIRYYKLFLNRIARLHDNATSLRDYTMQLRDLYKAHIDQKQNRIMTVLTVVTTIFMPLTLIVGWYGMNFKFMPELEWRWSYPVVIAVTILIAVGSLLFFKKKKWL